MSHPLHNPVFSALSGRDKRLGSGSDKAKYFDEDVSPFASFDNEYADGFRDLYDMLPSKRGILYAKPEPIETPANWKLLMHIRGIQMIHRKRVPFEIFGINIVPLNKSHVDEMVALAKLTVPGPFGKRTIEFGHYHGVFDGDKLVAMTGQRMHVDNYNEVSAVCTHPDHTGKGYASILTQHQVNLIYEQGNHPFLHVREDNTRAIRVYERLGFEFSRPMNFYLLRK